MSHMTSRDIALARVEAKFGKATYKGPLEETDTNATHNTPQVVKIAKTRPGISDAEIANYIREKQPQLLQTIERETTGSLSTRAEQRSMPGDCADRSGLAPKPVPKPSASASFVVSAALQTPQAPTFLLFCRPHCDVWAERIYNNDTTDPKTNRPRMNNIHGRGGCKCNKSPSSHPNWPWSITELGKELIATWQFDYMKKRLWKKGDREQRFDVFRDCPLGEKGIQNTINKHLARFDNQFFNSSDGCVDPYALWSHLESLALFTSTDIQEWHDANYKVAESPQTMALVGVALLTVIDIFHANGLFRVESKVKNLELILSLFVRFANDWDGFGRGTENEWARVVVQKADDLGIEMNTPFLIMETIERWREIEISDDEGDDGKEPGCDIGTEVDEYRGKRMWHKWNWETEWRKYSAKYCKTPDGKKYTFGSGQTLEVGFGLRASIRA